MTKQTRYRKQRGERLEVGIQPELKTLLLEAVSRSGKTLSDFVQDAIATKLRNWTAPMDYINQQREKTGKPLVSVFDGLMVDDCGWPLVGIQPSGGTSASLLRSLDVSEVQGFMDNLWFHAGLGDFTDQHLAQTMKAIGGKFVKVEAEATPKADWEQ